MKKALENHMDDLEMQAVRNELSIASRNEKIVEFEEELERLARESMGQDKAKAKEAVNEIINGWKEEYRKICRG